MVDVIAVLGDGLGDHDPARLVGLGMRDLGATAVLGTILPPSRDELMTVSCAMTSGDEVDDVLAGVENTVGPLHAVVLVSAGTAATEGGDLAALGPQQWRQRVELPLQRTLACFQGAHRRLRIGGGCVAVLVPTLSLVGSAGFSPWAAVAEGQRSLAKAAGRAWGRDGIRVNVVAVPGVLLRSPLTASPGAMESPDPDRPGQPAPALTERPDLRRDVAPLLLSLLSAPWAGVTGATVAVDGGVWMTP